MESTAVTSGGWSLAAREPQKTMREMNARRSMLIHPFNQVVADTQRIGHNRQSRIHGGTRREETAIHDVQIVHFVSFAVDIQGRGLRIVAETNSSILMSHAGQRNAVAHEQIARKKSLMTLVSMNGASALLLHQLLEFAVQPLVSFLVVGRIAENDVAVSIQGDAVIGIRQIFGSQP